MESALVMVILVGAVALFATERIPVDQVALLILATLLGFGLVTPAEGISGIGSPATVTVAAMFVLGAGLQRTGAVAALSGLLIRLSGRRWLLSLVVQTLVGAVSAFINNTAAVAVFLPGVLAASATARIPASRLLIPLSFASQFGGVCTLIGTSTNLLVSAVAEQAGVGAFSMFEFTGLGLVLFAAGTTYLLVLGPWLLPDRQRGELTQDYQLGEYITELRVTPGSPFIGKTVRESSLGPGGAVTVLELIRNGRRFWDPLSASLEAGDILLARGHVKELVALRGKSGLEIEPEFTLRDESLRAGDVDLVEVLVAPRSRLAGQTLGTLAFRSRYNAIVLAIQRRGQVLLEKLSDIRLRFGDALLLLGPREDLARLRADDQLILLRERRDVPLNLTHAPMAVAIMLGVVLLAAFDVLPILATAILGCAAMTVTGCIRLEDAYRAVDWRVIVLLAGTLPLGIALEKSGTARLLADLTVGSVRDAGPIAVLAVLYLLTAILTECMSNNAAAVLVAPIAITAAAKLGVSPKPFLVAVTFAASTSFATPVGYQTNTMVYNAGGYRFTDFLRIGVPLNLLFWGLAVLLIPRFWPF